MWRLRRTTRRRGHVPSIIRDAGVECRSRIQLNAAYGLDLSATVGTFTSGTAFEALRARPAALNPSISLTKGWPLQRSSLERSVSSRCFARSACDCEALSRVDDATMRANPTDKRQIEPKCPGDFWGTRL